MRPGWSSRCKREATPDASRPAAIGSSLLRLSSNGSRWVSGTACGAPRLPASLSGPGRARALRSPAPSDAEQLSLLAGRVRSWLSWIGSGRSWISPDKCPGGRSGVGSHASGDDDPRLDGGEHGGVLHART